MKKITFLFALLCASVMGWATDYCHTEMSAGGKTIYLTCQEVSAGNYQLKVECDEAMSGLGGSFCEVNGVGGYQLNAAGHFTLAADGKTITCDIASSTKPNVYTPLYVLIDGEKNFGSISDASWASCGGSTPEPTGGEKFFAANASENSTYFATGDGWTADTESSASYNNSTGVISINLVPGRWIQWQAQYKLNLGFEYKADKYYDFSITFHANKEVPQVTLKTNNNNALFYEDQSITIPEDDDYTYTKTDVAGVAGDNIFVFDFGHAAAGTEIEISEISIIEKDAPSTPAVVPDPNDYTAGGHTIHLDAYYVNDIYTLNITSTDDMQGLGGSFWNVNGVGTDMRSNAGTNSYTVSGDKKTITCQVQSSSAPNIYTPLYVLMPGEINFGNVTLNWEDRTPIASEYCSYQGPETQQDNHYYAITWETDPSGNVVITIGNGTGAGACSFRNGGFEGGNNGLANFVVSDDDFATTTPATDYFTVTRPSDGDLEYVMTKIADLPANAKIRHLTSGAIAWREAGADRWCWPEFTYTYGGTCNQLDAPTNVAIDANNILTFDAVTGADSYMAYVSLGGVEKYSQAVASGDELAFVALVTGDYIVNVVASASGKTDSDPSADLVWHLEAAPVVLGNSEYCEHVFMADDNREAAFTWETDGDGNIVITISATRGDAAATHFRGNGMALANFKVGAGKADASTYFNHACGGSNQVTLSLKNPANAPALGEKIYFNQTVEYATSLDGNAWPTLEFEWTYGTVCSGKSVSASVNNNTMGSAVVQKAGVDVTNVDAGDEVSFIATSANPELYQFVNWTKGGVEVSTSATYVTTITETTNLVANFDYIREAYCQYEILATGGAAVGKKLYMTIGSIGGGKYQIKYEGSAEAPLLALNNANYMVNNVSTDIEYIDPVSGNPVASSGGDVPFNKQNGRWIFDAAGNGSAKMEFELAPGKTIDDIYVWGNAIFFNTPLGELAYEDNNDRLKLFGMNAAKRHNIDWDATCSDTEAPVMVSAALDYKTASSAILNVSATDAHLDAYHVVDAVNGIDVVVPAAAQITIEGLVGGTTYNLTVKAVDVAGNESTTGIDVEVVMAATITAPTTAPAAPTWPAGQVISFYSDTYTAPNTWNFRAPWGGSTVYEQVVIEGNNIIHYSTLDYVGWIYEAGGTPYNAINMEKLHLDIWVADDCTIGIVPIYGGDGLTTDDNKRKKPALTGQQWNSIDLDLATDYAGLNLASIFQFKFDQATTTEFWVDNVYFYRTTELVDNEAPTNVTASVEETGFYSVKITAQAEDNMGSVNFSVMNGAVEVATGASVSGVPTTITVSNLTPGTAYDFTIIAKDDKPNEAAPVAVNATTKALPASAPVPATNGKVVVNVFSDAIEGSKTIHSGGWGETTQVEWLDIAEGDKVFYAQNFNYAGWHSWGADIDATGMQYLHVDVYSTGMTKVSVTPISHDPINENNAVIELTPNAWTSADIAMTAFGNVELEKIFQFKFMNPVDGNELLIDNVYFWSYGVKTNVDKWSTFASPVAVQVPSDVTAYKAVYSNANGDEVLELTASDGIIPANTGVLLKGEDASTEYAFTVTDATSTTDWTDNSLVGCAVRTDISTVAATNDIFCLRRSDLFDQSAFFLYSGQYIPAGKAYLALPKDNSGSANPAPQRRVRFVFNNEQTTTGVESVQPSGISIQKVMVNGVLYIIRGEAVYTIQGARMK